MYALFIRKQLRFLRSITKYVLPAVRLRMEALGLGNQQISTGHCTTTVRVYSRYCWHARLLKLSTTRSVFADLTLDLHSLGKGARPLKYVFYQFGLEAQVGI